MILFILGVSLVVAGSADSVQNEVAHIRELSRACFLIRQLVVPAEFAAMDGMLRRALDPITVSAQSFVTCT